MTEILAGCPRITDEFWHEIDLYRLGVCIVGANAIVYLVAAYDKDISPGKIIRLVPKAEHAVPLIDQEDLQVVVEVGGSVEIGVGIIELHQEREFCRKRCSASTIL